MSLTALVLVCGAMLVPSSPPAAAATSTAWASVEQGSITLSNRAPKVGTTVTVTGTGFRAGRAIAVYQCASKPVAATQCTSPLAQATTDATGAFTAEVRALDRILSEGVTVDCTVATGSCSIAAAEQDDLPSTIVSVPVTVGGLGTITVTPDTDLVGGQEVEIAGTGWVPDSTVFLRQCELYLSYFTCEEPEPVGADGTGAFRRLLVVHQESGPSCVRDFLPCLIVASYLSDVTPTVGSVSFARISLIPRLQPDLQVIRLIDGALLGDNSHGPLLTRTVPAGGSWTYALRLENDGQTDSIRLWGPGGDDHVRITYVSGWFDVTAQATSGSLVFPRMPHGASHVIGVRFDVDEAAPSGWSFEADVVAYSTSGTAQEPGQDLVRLGVRVK